MHYKSIAAAVGCISLVRSQEQQRPLRGATFDIPLLGFGTWNILSSNASDVVATALATGYRHLDCAAIYGNEKQVGRGIEQAGISRKEVWITSKLWNDHHSPKDVPKALEKTLADLGLDYLDLYLMHWPVARNDGNTTIDFIETWKALTKLPTDRVHHIGISNFSPSQLHDLLAATPDHVPYAHQMEMHPYLPQASFLKLHNENNIHVTAYSPLGSTNPTYGSSRKDMSALALPPLLKSPLLQEIAANAGCTPAQAALAWGMLRGTSVIPKSVHLDRMKQNFESQDCKLSDRDVQRLEEELPVKRFNNPSKGWGVHLFDGLEDSKLAGDASGFSGISIAVTEWLAGVWNVFGGWTSDL